MRKCIPDCIFCVLIAEDLFVNILRACLQLLRCFCLLWNSNATLHFPDLDSSGHCVAYSAFLGSIASVTGEMFAIGQTTTCTSKMDNTVGTSQTLPKYPQPHQKVPLSSTAKGDKNYISKLISHIMVTHDMIALESHNPRRPPCTMQKASVQ